MVVVVVLLSSSHVVMVVVVVVVLFEPQLGDPSVATGNRSVTLSPAAYSSTWLNARTGARLATNVEAHKVGRLNN